MSSLDYTQRESHLAKLINVMKSSSQGGFVLSPATYSGPTIDGKSKGLSRHGSAELPNKLTKEEVERLSFLLLNVRNDPTLLENLEQYKFRILVFLKAVRGNTDLAMQYLTDEEKRDVHFIRQVLAELKTQDQLKDLYSYLPAEVYKNVDFLLAYMRREREIQHEAKLNRNHCPPNHHN